MNVAHAAYDTVHEHEGGAAAVAARIGVGRQVLVNKLNPQNTTHHLTLDEAVRLIKVTGDFRLMHALADEFKGVFIPLPDQGGASTVVGHISEMSLEFGSLIKEVASDLQ